MNRELPALTPKKVISALERANFFVHHTKGSHHALRHREDPNIRITIAFHRKDIKLGTLRSIIKQAGLTVDEFLDLL